MQQYPLLQTKLYIPPIRPELVSRPSLIERLNAGLRLGRKLTLISAPAGYGKTTLVSEWVDRLRSACVREGQSGRAVAWLSLDDSDNDLTSFLVYLIAALQTIEVSVGKGVFGALQTPQPPPAEAILTSLINEIAAFPGGMILVLDDYHLIEAQPIHGALTFLLEHLPPQMHLVIATREDPLLPLARLRVRGQLTELRAADLRFTASEAAGFLNEVMGLNLSAEDIAALETRTEGWIAGLQMAAISMQRQPDPTRFIQSFTGSHRFILDYLLEEVLERQPGEIRNFLLRTSILEPLCGPLCEAVLGTQPGSGQSTLEALERANLFLVPLDNERRWYRYHHLFGDLLQQRLGQSLTSGEIAKLHIRASEWYENNSLAFEAFHHAAAAKDVERAERLIESDQLDLYLHTLAKPVLDWLASLPKTVKDARPRLWVRSATLALMAGQTSGVEEKLRAAEYALQGAGLDEEIRDLVGQIACARATLAFYQHDPERMVLQAQRALEYLNPENLAYRFSSNWVLATAHMFRGNRAAAARVCQECIAISQKSGRVFSKILATITLSILQEMENQLHQAAETCRQVLELAGDHPLPLTEEVHLRLARIYYEWNDLEAAEQHGRQSLELARLFDRVIDRFIVSEVFLARLQLAQGNVDGAAAMLAQTEQSARQKNFALRLPEIAAAQVQALLQQTNLPAAAELARRYELPLSQARVFTAQGDSSAALALLAPFRQQMEARGWADERLKAMVLQAVTLHQKGEKAPAVQLLGEALALAEPGGFIRIFVDEGEPMAELLVRMNRQLAGTEGGRRKEYVHKLLAAFGKPKDIHPSPLAKQGVSLQPLVEPLSERELNVLRLLRTELNGPEIARELVVSLNTMRTHTKSIYSKLGVNNRRAAVHRAEDLGLL